MTEITKILVAIDFSENAPKILEAAAYVANKFEAELCVVHVVEGLEDYSGFAIPHISLEKLEEDLRKAAESKMAGFVEDEMAELKTPVPFKDKVLTGDVAEELKQYVTQENCHLIIIGTHGYKGLEKTLFGSVAEKVLKVAPCPVLTVNPYKLK